MYTRSKKKSKKKKKLKTINSGFEVGKSPDKQVDRKMRMNGWKYKKNDKEVTKLIIKVFKS